MFQLNLRYALLSIVILITAPFAATSLAQSNALPDSQPSPTPNSTPIPSLESRFFRNVLRDQRAIWTAPFSTKRSDAKWIAPLAVSAAALFSTDRQTAGELTEVGDHRSRLRISKDVSKAGSFYTTTAIASSFYLIGRASHSARARETGLLGLEALFNAEIVTSVLKVVSERQRPIVDHASGEFFDGGRSFPSGHAAGAWSLATVIAQEYKNRPLVQVAAYSIATAVSVSRFTGQNHFLSDVLIGSAIGYGIGRYVYHTHHDPGLDVEQDRHKHRGTHSKLLPLVSPVYSRSARAYGARMAWSF